MAETAQAGGGAVAVADVDPGATERSSRYRDAGWWPGEPLVARFRRHLAARPGARAVRDGSTGWLTREQLWAKAGALADEMVVRGVRPGDVVLICLPNRVTWLSTFLACLRLDTVPATLPATSDPTTLRYASKLVTARLVVMTQDGYAHRDAASEDSQSEGGTFMAPLVLILDEEDGQRWEQCERTVDVPLKPISGLSHIMFTSSTTGMPKAVAHTEDTLAAVSLAFVERFGLDDEGPIFMGSPLGHSVGAWHGARLSLFTGAPLVLQDVWEPVRALRTIEEEGCAFTAAATPFLKDLVDADWAGSQPKLAAMRTFLCGGTSVPPALLAAAAEQMPQTFFTVLWGMTEGGVTTCLPSDPPERIVSTVGVGLPGLDLRALSAEGTPLPAGATGELAMRGPGVFVGYYNQEELYREMVTPDGFFRTGDLAEVSTDGYVRLTGRLKDLIIRGGVNISPVPLENLLSGHPNIRHVAVIGAPDDRMGERICAVIVPNGPAPSLPGLLAWLDDKDLPRRLRPERLVVVDSMPQTAAGKIRKPALRAAILAKLT